MRVLAKRGILDLQVSADYDLSSGLVHDIRNGAFGTSALYLAGSVDMFLVSGNIGAVDEPEPMAVLGLGVTIVIGVPDDGTRSRSGRRSGRLSGGALERHG